jgi:hypothetical protein
MAAWTERSPFFRKTPNDHCAHVLEARINLTLVMNRPRSPDNPSRGNLSRVGVRDEL